MLPAWAIGLIVVGVIILIAGVAGGIYWGVTKDNQENDDPSIGNNNKPTGSSGGTRPVGGSGSGSGGTRPVGGSGSGSGGSGGSGSTVTTTSRCANKICIGGGKLNSVTCKCENCPGIDGTTYGPVDQCHTQTKLNSCNSIYGIPTIDSTTGAFRCQCLYGTSGPTCDVPASLEEYEGEVCGASGKVCSNGGVLDPVTCKCKCYNYRKGEYIADQCCSDGIFNQCINGTVDEFCDCKCNTSCGPNGIQNPDCSCRCIGGWSGPDCKIPPPAGLRDCVYNGIAYKATTCCDTTKPCRGFMDFNTCTCNCYNDCGPNGTRNPDCTCTCRNGFTGASCQIPPNDTVSVNVDQLYADVRAGRTVRLELLDGSVVNYNPSTVPPQSISVYLKNGSAFIFVPTAAPAAAQPPATGCPPKNCGAGRQSATTCNCVCDPGFSGATCRVRTDFDYNQCVNDKSGTLKWTGYQCITNAGGCPVTRPQICRNYGSFWYVNNPNDMSIYECTLGDERAGGTIGDSVNYANNGRCMTGQSEAGCNQLIQWLGCK